jgi:hypothetical protein
MREIEWTVFDPYGPFAPAFRSLWIDGRYRDRHGHLFRCACPVSREVAENPPSGLLESVWREFVWQRNHRFDGYPLAVSWPTRDVGRGRWGTRLPLRELESEAN